MTPSNHPLNVLPGFEALFKTYYSPLCYFALYYVPTAEQAEDVVQSVFTKWLQEQPIYHNEAHARNLLYRMVKQTALNELRRLNLHTHTLNNLTLTDETVADDYFEQVVRTEVYRQILEAINQLPTACANVFKLAYLKQMDNEEVARALSISINTVKVQKNKAKKRLRQLLRNL